MSPHSTHLLQPLDVGLFGPLQQYYSTYAAEILYSMDYQLSLSKAQFYQAFRRAHNKTFIKKSILSAWRRSGYFPYNPNFIIRQCKETTPPVVGPVTTDLLQTPRTLKDIIDVENQLAAHDISPSQRHLVNILAKSAELNAVRCNLLETQLKASQTAYKERQRRGSRRRLISGQNSSHLVTSADIQSMKADLDEKQQAAAAKTQQPRRRGRPPKQPTRSVLAAVLIDNSRRRDMSPARINDHANAGTDINPFVDSDRDSITSSESPSDSD